MNLMTPIKKLKEIISLSTCDQKIFFLLNVLVVYKLNLVEGYRKRRLSLNAYTMVVLLKP